MSFPKIIIKHLAFWYLLILLAKSVNAACELMPEKISRKSLVGHFNVSKMRVDTIAFDPEHGDMSGKNSKFSFDELYEMVGRGGKARFRINEEFFVGGSSHIGNLQLLVGSKVLAPGRYRFYELKTEHQHNGKILTTIGDSITWWSQGRYFRCLLSPYLPGVNFTGPHTDTIGYGHAGEGGDDSFDIIARLDKIEPANVYFLLAGTNDWRKVESPEQTFNNLQKISSILASKGGIVIISTLLPRLDEHDNRNKQVNHLLREWRGDGCNCIVVDLYSLFQELPKKKELFWDAGLHPNLKGYAQIAKILGPRINEVINQNEDPLELVKKSRH